jgi:Flp pilus assembly protein TadG
MLRSALSVSKNSPRRPRPGVAAAEFALVAPVLFALVLGIFELARGIMVKDVLNNAARKGARTGATANADDSSITSEVNGVLTANGIAVPDATLTIQVNGVTINSATARRGDRVSVRVAIPVARIYWVSTLFLSAATVESEVVVMMRQG